MVPANQGAQAILDITGFWVTVAALIAALVWRVNEKKFKVIIRREIKLGIDNSPEN